MKNRNNINIIESVKRWVELVVIDLNLCPFAKREILNNKVRFVVSEAETEEQLLFDLHSELELLSQDESIETTLLIHPEVLKDFPYYNQFLHFTDELLVQMKLEGVFQVASFHPDYQFAEYGPDDVENYTNRSPYPMLHLLREDSLTTAIDSHPDIHSVPIRNKELMRKLGIPHLRSLLRDVVRGA